MDENPALELMKSVLFVAYSFPPKGGAGVQRTVKFVRYLPEYGWQPAVLTTSELPGMRDDSLLADIPAGTPITKVRGIAIPPGIPWRVRRWITRWLLVIDQEIGWLPIASRVGVELHQKDPWAVIYSTAPPYTNHLVGRTLKEKTRTPWVADFRDAWIDNPAICFPTGFHRELVTRQERSVVYSADRIVVVSEPMRQQFIARYADLSPERFVVIPNGFDESDYQDARPAARDQRFTLIYTGSLYLERRTADAFLAALRKAIDHQEIRRDEIRVLFVGSTGPQARQVVEALGLDSLVEFTGYLPHSETIPYQLCADALLLIIGRGPGSQAVLTGKIFEYLRAGKPILALIPDGAAADLLAESGSSLILPPDDVEEISRGLVALLQDWRSGISPGRPDPSVVASYDRKFLTGRLAQVFDQIGS